MMRANRGYTMVELVVYTGLSALVLGVILTVFASGRGNFEAVSSSYLVSQDAEAALRWLKTDLRETTIGSLRVYPNSDSPASPPGISMASARNLNNDFQFSKWGGPQWTTYVYYTVDDEGKLIRWMEEHDFKGVPLASNRKPESSDGRESERVILRNLVQPGDELEELGTMGERGGFDFQFVRYSDDGDEVLTSYNPMQVTSDDLDEPPEGRNTTLVSLLLTVSMSNYRQRNVSYVQLPVRVVPQN